MATWYYYNENGEKIGPVRGRELKQLAKAGQITPETLVETEEGKTVSARKIQGLTFVEPMPSAPPPQPVSAPSPFVQPVAVASASVPPIAVNAPDPSSMSTSDSFSDVQYEIDYKRNRRYFSAQRRIAIILIVLGLVTLLAIIGIIFIVVGIILWIYAAASTATDAEIDQTSADYVKNNLKSMALTKLGIDENQVQEIAPIQFHDYYYENISTSSWRYKVRYKWGKDRRYRASNYMAFTFFFSTDQVLCYELDFSLLEDKKVEKTNEYFFGDIVDLSTEYGEVARGAGQKFIEMIGPIQ